MSDTVKLSSRLPGDPEINGLDTYADQLHEVDNWHPQIHSTFQEPTVNNETSRPSFVSLEVTKKHAISSGAERSAEVSISDPTRKDVKAMVQLAAETIKEVLK